MFIKYIEYLTLHPKIHLYRYIIHNSAYTIFDIPNAPIILCFLIICDYNATYRLIWIFWYNIVHTLGRMFCRINFDCKCNNITNWYPHNIQRILNNIILTKLLSWNSRRFNFIRFMYVNTYIKYVHTYFFIANFILLNTFPY